MLLYPPKELPPSPQIRTPYPFVIGTEVGWTEVFAARSGEVATLAILINEGVPLSIGEINLSLTKMADLWNTVESKVYQMFEQGTWSNWNSFYRQMQTLKDTETFLGVNLL